MFKRLSLFFTILLLLTTLVVTFHHHDDGADHPECSICFATHQQADAGHIAPAYIIISPLGETFYPWPVPAIVAETIISPFNNRAPPA